LDPRVAKVGSDLARNRAKSSFVFRDIIFTFMVVILFEQGEVHLCEVVQKT
jgi:hypothetical protein